MPYYVKILKYYRKELALLFQVQENLKASRNSKGLHLVVFAKFDILQFSDNMFLLKCYPLKVL